MSIINRTRRLDSLFEGKLSLYQCTPGYRFSIDSVLLAHFAKVSAGEKVLDLGTGCGVIGLIMLYRHCELDIQITGIERQTELAALARENIKINGYQDQFKLYAADVADCRCYLQPESFSLVVANPPFYEPGAGRTSLDGQAKGARQLDATGLDAFIEAASYSVKNRGRVVMIYPAERTPQLIQSMSQHRIEVKNMQFIYSYPDSQRPAQLALVEGLKNGGKGVTVAAPWYIYQHKNGHYCDYIQSMFEV